jgi:ectoine hydroxylase-related dioxygenase (phytanoyl-CoA dioxygenase family)
MAQSRFSARVCLTERLDRRCRADTIPSMLPTCSSREQDWLENTLDAVRYSGAGIVTDVLSPELLGRIREAMYEAQEHTLEEVGKDRLDRAREVGVMRVMLNYDPVFAELLELPEILAIVDNTVSSTAVMHLQNGLILPPYDGEMSDVLQYTFHMDFPRYMDGYMASVNTMLAIDEFTVANGGTRIVPGTHQRSGRPGQRYMEEASVAVECPAGSMFVFDSTLWHAAGRNTTDHDRLAINHMFTRSFFKQQIDYVRSLGDDFVLEQSSRTQQLLGWYTRVVTSPDEYYRPTEERLYRAHQG